MRKLTTIGVMGSGREEHRELTVPLGERLARLGVHLLTGGGTGVMSAVAEGFVAVESRAGLSLGVLPGRVDDDSCEAPPGYPNRYVELAIRTHLPGRGEEGGTPLSRNAINIASADAVVVLPGGKGTRSEARLAMQWRKPVIGLGGGGGPEGVPQAESIEEVVDFLRDALGLREAEGRGRA